MIVKKIATNIILTYRSKVMSDKKEKLKGIQITTPTFRLSFPRLDKPEAYKGKGTEFFSCTMLFDKEDNLDKLKKAVTGAIVEKFGKDKKKWPKIKRPWRDGDTKTDLDGYEGMTYINTKNARKPLFIDRDKTKLSDASKLYAGCYAQAVLIVKAVESGSDWYVTCYLQAVRFVKDGESFAGANVDIDEAFEDLEDDENDESNYEDDSEDTDDEDDSEDDDDFEI